MIGKTLGYYEVSQKLGSGGMGDVYLARDTKLGRDVAIKILPEAFSQDKERLARFEREAHILASLNHPNIATIHELGESEGQSFLVLEFVPGETLAERISRSPIPLDEAVGVFSQIAEGLEAAHEKGVIHRDLKPANIKITPDDKVKVLDFGLAKAYEPEPGEGIQSESPTITREGTKTGVILGTAAYMSPEQARGKALDKRTDIWSFGCVLYEALGGKAAFLGETISDTIARILEREPDWEALPETTPRRIRILLTRCLQKKLRDRLCDIGDARLELKEVDDLAEPLDETLAPPPLPLWRRTLPWILVILGGTAALLVSLRGPPTVEQPLRHLSIPTEPLALTSSGGGVLALSRDGTLLVYVGEKDGGQQLFLRSMDSRDTVPLAGTEEARHPFFSPDSNWVGFFANGELKKVSVKGGTPLTLCEADGIEGASWEEGQIIFGTGGGRSFFLVPDGGGTPQPVGEVQIEEGEWWHTLPELLPAGKAVIFTTLDSSAGSPRIVIQSLDTAERRVLIEGAGGARYSPTSHLVYPQGESLLAVPFDLEELELSGSPVPILEGVLNDLRSRAQFRLSHQGSLVYVPTVNLTPERVLVWVDRKGEEDPIRTFDERFIGPRISPDGNRVALWMLERNQIWIYEMARGIVTPLTLEGQNGWPIWSTDGGRVAFNRFGSGIFSIPVDGSAAAEQLSQSEIPQVPYYWSPDGQALIFQQGRGSGVGSVWVLPLEGDREPWPFADAAHTEIHPTLSPDGRWLAYASNESGRMQVTVKAFPGPGPRFQISTEGGWEPVWAPNGREIFYRNNESNQMMVVAIVTEPELDVSEPQILFEGPYRGGVPYGRNYDLTPDGRRFLMVKDGEPPPPSEQINVVFNWLEELKRLAPEDEQ
jgi:serine/threonine-protein kinase